MIQIGDRVQVGSRIGAKLAWGTVVDTIPANDDRRAIYRVRFDDSNEGWIDEGLICAAYHQSEGFTG